MPHETSLPLARRTSLHRILGLLLAVLLMQGLLSPTFAGAAEPTSGLLLSRSSDRSNPVNLDGATTSGGIYVFSERTRGVKQVDFYVDDPARSRAPYRTERSAPYDLEGGAAFDTRKLPAGAHTVTAAVTLIDGTKQVATASFTVEGAKTSAGLLLSTSSNRSNPVNLDGARTSGGIYVFSERTSGVKQVDFYVDDPARSRAPYRTERSAPYDLEGGAAFDTTTLANGTHTVTASTTLSTSGNEVVTATFTVGNGADTPSPTPTPTPTPTPIPTPTPSPTPGPANLRTSLLSEVEGFAHKVTGGLAGKEYHVTNLNDSGAGSLRAGTEASEPLWIRFDVSGTIRLSTPIEVASNKTIDGRGQRIQITGHGLYIDGKFNVIVSHLIFDQAGTTADKDDAVRIINKAQMVWVNRCSFLNSKDSLGTDGALDITEASTDVTVSWSRFTKYDHVMLIGSSPSKTGDKVIRVTVHHNVFDGTKQRHPRVRFGKVHAYNNYLRAWQSYGMASTVQGELYAENNVYEAGSDKEAITIDQAGEPKGYAKSVGNMLMGGAAIEANEPDRVFDPGAYYPRPKVDVANDVLRNALSAQAGWQQVTVAS